jgi:hypothetical protein
VNDRVTVYNFRSRSFARGGEAIVAVAPRDAVVHVFGGGGVMDADGLNRVFGGSCVFRDETTKACFLGVWGRREAARFRGTLRRAGLDLAVEHAPPPARLVLWTTMRLTKRSSARKREGASRPA